MTLYSQKLGYKIGCLYIIYFKANLSRRLEFVVNPLAVFVDEGFQIHVKILQSILDRLYLNCLLKVEFMKDVNLNFVVSVCILGSRCLPSAFDSHRHV